MSNTTLERLRALVHGEPSVERWERVVQALEPPAPPVVFDYAREHLRRWPAAARPWRPTPDAFAALLSASEGPPTPLLQLAGRLVLSGRALGDEAALALSAVDLGGITQLDLSDNALTRAGAAAVARLSLERLDLRRNPIGFQAAAALNALPHTVKLGTGQGGLVREEEGGVRVWLLFHPSEYTREFTVGRRASNDFQLMHRSVSSGTHARLIQDPESGFWFDDWNHTNGCFLNGARLAPGRHLLCHGDEIRFAAAPPFRLLELDLASMLDAARRDSGRRLLDLDVNLDLDAAHKSR